MENSKYLERTFKRPEVSISCIELAYMFKEWKKSWNLLEPESFDVFKNDIAPIIVILGHLEVNIEILNASMKTIMSNNYKGILEDNKNANNVLY